MLELLIDSIFVEFGGSIFQENIGIRMGTNCALISDCFLYSYEAEVIKNVLKTNNLQKLKSLISLPGILMMFFQLIIQNFANWIP